MKEDIEVLKHTNIIINPCQINLDVINDIRAVILKSYTHLFEAVIVHGSIATNEIIPYSDFDGILIVKDEFSQSVELKKFIRKTSRIIYNFDPLQHHGWFIIRKSEFTNYDTTYLPLELFEHSKLIYPNLDVTFEVKVMENIDFFKPFDDLSYSILKKIERNNYKKNSFQLKSYLSQIMLLPCLYLQAKNKKGVHKKHSFSIAKKDFDKISWKAIEISSDIRVNWNYKINYFQKIITKSNNYIITYLFKNFLAPKINDDLNKKINNNFNESLIRLINQMRKHLKKIRNY